MILLLIFYATSCKLSSFREDLYAKIIDEDNNFIINF
jgi:hypothetical protein